MKLRRVTNNIGPNLRKKTSLIEFIPKNAYRHFKGVTPKRSGNARSKTDYKSTSFGGTIEANYPYANRLNEGYSRQAPDGMTEPTVDHIRDQVRRRLG